MSDSGLAVGGALAIGIKRVEGKLWYWYRGVLIYRSQQPEHAGAD
jgi:hypothetical protein